MKHQRLHMLLVAFGLMALCGPVHAQFEPDLNNPPVANTDYWELEHYSPAGTMLGINDNDYDPNGGSFSLVNWLNSAQTLITYDTTRRLYTEGGPGHPFFAATYTGTGFTGQDTFIYQIQDPEGAVTDGIVHLTIGRIRRPRTMEVYLDLVYTDWLANQPYLWEINDVAGTRGADPGWDWRSFYTPNAGVNIAGGGGTIPIWITSLTLANESGPVHNFDDQTGYTWIIATSPAGFTGFDPAKFEIVTTDFQNTFTGTFSVEQSQSGTDIVLRYSPAGEAGAPPLPTDTPTPVATATETPTETATAVATETPTAAATGTAISTATATATVTPAPGGVGIDVESVQLSTWRANANANGFLILRARLDDTAGGGTLVDRVLGGGFEVVVRDGDASFEVAVPLVGCARRGDRGLTCSPGGPRPVRVTITPEDRRATNPTTFDLRLSARGLPDSETGAPVPGMNPMEGPVTVFLLSPADGGSASLSGCRQRGGGSLICRR